jgi:hypothetical protein
MTKSLPSALYEKNEPKDLQATAPIISDATFGNEDGLSSIAKHAHWSAPGSSLFHP